MKEIQFSPNIAEHDYQVKLKKIKSLLAKSEQVKAMVIFKGRQKAYLDLGENIHTKLILDLVPDFGTLVSVPKVDINNFSVIFNPKKKS